MAVDFELQDHKKWLGFLQPVGLVVSPMALAEAQVAIPRNAMDIQQRLESVVRRDPLPGTLDDTKAWIADFPSFATNVLGWERTDLADASVLPEALSVPLPDYGEVLAPTYAVPDPDKAGAWLLLIQVVPAGIDLDDAGPVSAKTHSGWHAAPQAKFERLLRSVEIPIGLLCNGTHLRLVYAPRGETSGFLTFPVQAMTEVAGRLILGGMHELLSADRLFSVRKDRRLPALLEASRKYQNEVSTRLAEQVMAALNDLLRGFQAADASAQGALLGSLPLSDPRHVYGGLLTTLMRLVFLLYAEDRGLMPSDPVYGEHYSVAGLFDKLRADAGRYPDTMDRRYGAWARLLSLFRLVYDGGQHGTGLKLPPRHGRLFDPDAYPFLEGRPAGVGRVVGERFEPPRVTDGVIFRVLNNLLMLSAERLSYRTLDVEQIGSVYEAMMGYDLTVAAGPSIAVRPHHVMIDVGELLDASPGERAKRLKDLAACDLTGASLAALKEATAPDQVVAAIGRKVSPRTPTLLATGSLYLQPGEERRRSGSHYTPRSLTEPIVRTTLRPILEALGPRPTPERILELKVCDPAMGSGAFLVEACRQLADGLVRAWDVHNATPVLPPDEEPLLHARRLVAQSSLYGVDRNPFAVDLAKLSLWLVTLAKDHAFTFLDHALRWGDSLVGLTRAQIAAFDWKVDGKTPRQLDWLDGQVEAALLARIGLQNLKEGDYEGRHEKWLDSENALADARLIGDVCVAAFFAADKDRAREEKRREYLEKVRSWREGKLDRLVIEDIRDELRGGERPVVPFNWEAEFPEVFGRLDSGFDAIVGNPPFMGGRNISMNQGERYLGWLLQMHSESTGGADLVAHFFRSSFNHLRTDGALGLVATNSLAQGDTRSSGLTWICTHDGTIFHAIKRMRWPGTAAVAISVVHIARGPYRGDKVLDGKRVPFISAFLFNGGGHRAPARLLQNSGKSFQGSIVLGNGFLFDDEDDKATSLAEMRRLIAKDRRNADRIRPYLGGEEFNDSPDQSPRRYAISFGEMAEAEARQWPDLLRIIEEKVRPEREQKSKEMAGWPWWRYWRTRRELYESLKPLSRAIVGAQVSLHFGFAFQPTDRIFAMMLNVFLLDSYSAFSGIQSRTHELWARFFGSSLEDRLRYTPTDCFETFPFPPNWESSPTLESAGQTYYDFRAALMICHNEGLTKTYNRFHDPDHDGTGIEGRSPSDVIADIERLRDLHAQMDQAVLDAYGWTDIPTRCEFLLDYEDDDPGDEDDGKRHRKKPWRLRWPDDIRDEVLARLLDLNAKRAEEEKLAGAQAEAKAPAALKKGRPKKASDNPDIFGGS